jgi:hypothetical protein
MNTVTSSYTQRVSAYLQCADEALAGIPNLVASVASVGAGEWRTPVTVNDHSPGNAWVCSPHTTYVDYAIEEAGRVLPAAIALPLALICRGIGALLRRARIDRAVAINNWLVSTNLYPEPIPGTAARWIDEACGRWPDHALWFRSLNQRHNSALIGQLENAGCVLVPSRQVYLFESVDPEGRDHADLRRDFRLLAREACRLSPASEWSSADYQQAERLYAALYMDKYSALNPRYTARFLRPWAERGLIELSGFRDGRGVLQAVVGTFSLDGTVTSPIVGYETALPQKLGLYRLLAATVLKSSAERGWRINLSAGAADFKRQRGGIPEMEYSAVFDGHLPLSRRMAIRALASITQRIGKPIMKRYAL